MQTIYYNGLLLDVNLICLLHLTNKYLNSRNEPLNAEISDKLYATIFRSIVTIYYYFDSKSTTN